MNQTIIEEFDFEKQISETNILGNALLAGLVKGKIAQKKQKLSSRILSTSDLLTFKNEIEKLKSLKIGSIHEMLNIKMANEIDIQIDVASKLLLKIDKILQTHVRLNAENVISSSELEELKNNINIFQSIKEELTIIQNDSEERIQKVGEYQKKLCDVVSIIKEFNSRMSKIQCDLVTDASAAMNNI